MSRTLSLRTWLALGLSVAIAAPAAAGAAAWLAAGAWQAEWGTITDLLAPKSARARASR